MISLAEKLGPVVRILQEFGIDPRYPASLVVPRLYTLAPRLVKKLADAS